MKLERPNFRRTRRSGSADLDKILPGSELICGRFHLSCCALPWCVVPGTSTSMTFTMAPLGTGHRPVYHNQGHGFPLGYNNRYPWHIQCCPTRQNQASQCSLPHHRIPLRCRTVSSSWLGNINPAPCREAKQRWRHVRAPLGFTGELHKQLLHIIVDRRGKEKRQTKKHHQAVTANHANPAYTIRLVQPIPHPPG